MRKIAIVSVNLGVILTSLLPGTPAQSAPRTFVSGTGSDSGTCPRAAPCLTFAFAIGVTDAGGEINCVDAGDFGNLSINKSITIDCTGTTAGIFAPSGATGVLVNTNGVVATLRGLSIDGAGSGGIGINFNLGAALRVEDCRILGFGGGIGYGIRFRMGSNVTAQLHISDSVIENNGLPASGGGIIIQPSFSGIARVMLNRVRVENNTHGILADGTGGTASIVVQVRDSVSAGNTGNGIAAVTNAGAATTGIVVDRSSSVANAGSGILTQGQGALIHIGRSTVVGNGAGLNAASGGQIHSYQNNRATGNGVEGGPTGVLALK
jgi:hypothetical protein